MIEEIQKQIDESIHVKAQLPLPDIQKAVSALIDMYKNKKKLILAGNGGSAADAQHIAAEFVGRYLKERPPLPAIALTANSSSVTAIGNDYGYDAVFSRQLQGYAESGDIFWAISTSGNSKNLVLALEKATELGIKTIALTGRDGGKMGSLADIHICVSHPSTPRIQESHILIYHIICDLVEKALF